MPYLSGLFLDHLDKEQSIESVTAAIAACNKEYESRTETMDIDEYRAFWDVFKDYEEEFPSCEVPVVVKARQIAIETGMIK